jgi:opacity protein-like surface antigen
MEIENISSAVSELDDKIKKERDRRTSLLNQLGTSSKPLPALTNLYKRLEKQNKLKRFLAQLEQSKTPNPEKRSEFNLNEKHLRTDTPSDSSKPSLVTDQKKEWKSKAPKTSPPKERPTFKRGQYYLFPFAGVLIPSDTTYKLPSGQCGELASKTGYTAGITGGRRFGNLNGGLSLGVNHHKFDSLTNDPSFSYPSTSGRGESYLINLSGRLGYACPISQRSWLRFGGGLGLGYRAEGGAFYFGSTKVPLETSKKTAFSYEVFGELGYGLTEHLRVGLGYRYLGAGKHGNFGTYGSHSIELGLGGDF